MRRSEGEKEGSEKEKEKINFSHVQLIFDFVFKNLSANKFYCQMLTTNPLSLLSIHWNMTIYKCEIKRTVWMKLQIKPCEI